MHRGEYLKRQAEWTWKEAQKEMQAEQEFTSCGDGAVIRLKNTTPHRLLLVDSAQKIKQPWRIYVYTAAERQKWKTRQWTVECASSR